MSITYLVFIQLNTGFWIIVQFVVLCEWRLSRCEWVLFMPAGCAANRSCSLSGSSGDHPSSCDSEVKQTLSLLSVSEISPFHQIHTDVHHIVSFAPPETLTSRETPSPWYDITAQGSGRALQSLRWVSWIFNEAERWKTADWTRPPFPSRVLGAGLRAGVFQQTDLRSVLKQEAEINLNLHNLFPKQWIYSC